MVPYACGSTWLRVFKSHQQSFVILKKTADLTNASVAHQFLLQRLVVVSKEMHLVRKIYLKFLAPVYDIHGVTNGFTTPLNVVTLNKKCLKF